MDNLTNFTVFDFYTEENHIDLKTLFIASRKRKLRLEIKMYLFIQRAIITYIF